jgi:hypothetical protein
MGGRLKPLQSTRVQNVFGDDESDEEKPQTSAEKFQSKYGNLKARDERAVKKVLEENPDIYDYDGAYDSVQERRNKVEQEKEAAKVDKTVTIQNNRDLKIFCLHACNFDSRAGNVAGYSGDLQNLLNFFLRLKSAYTGL